MGLKELIESREAVVGIIGLGYVGLPLAMAAAGVGFDVVGLEKDENKRGKLERGEVLYEGLDSGRLKKLVSEGFLKVTGELKDIYPCHVICVCVPTPLSKTREPDLRFVREASEQVAVALQGGECPKLIVLESTTYPGTTREVVLPKLGLLEAEVCEEFHLAYSPERVDPGNVTWTIENTPKLMGGVNPCCSELAQAFYSSFVEDTVAVSSPEVAEMAKLLENIFRGVNIALVNELWMLCDRMGMDVWEVIGAAATKPFGFMPFWPGPGLGGHCIPVDPFYLAWKAREFDFQTEFIELAGKVNVNMPYFVAGLVVHEMNQAGKSLKDSRVMIVGVAYKPDVADTRETPAARLMELLEREDAEVIYHDPCVPEFELNGRTLHSLELSEDVLKECDCVVIITAHSGVDYDLIAGAGVPVVDTRNVLAGGGKTK